MNLSKDEFAMVREAARGMNTAEVDNFVEQVCGELDKLVVPITRNHIRSACTSVLARGRGGEFVPRAFTSPLGATVVRSRSPFLAQSASRFHS